MPTKAVIIDCSSIIEFVEELRAAGNGAFNKELAKFVDGIGNEFLRIVEDEIVRLNVVDTRLLFNSFHKGGDGNIFVISEGGLQLEVGTNVEYASYVNDGHWTNKKGQSSRWIPGVWSGDKFTYTPGATTGMLLKQQWIEGRHYFDSAIRIIERMIPEFLDRKLDEWLTTYFGM